MSNLPMPDTAAVRSEVEFRARVKQAIAETEKLKAREMKYSVQFRNNELVATYDAHLLELNRMLMVWR